MIDFDLDASRLNSVTDRYVTELGHAAADTVKNQTGLLQQALVKGAPPKDLAAAKKVAAKDLKTVFMPVPEDIFKGDQAGNAGSPTLWLYGHPQLLVGVRRPMDKRGIDGEQGMSIYYRNQKRLGQSATEVGTRGKQKVILRYRYLVKKSTLSRMASIVGKKFGKIKAGFAFGWEITNGTRRRPPAWIFNHVLNRDVDASFINLLATKDNPTWTIINRANGVERERVTSFVAAQMNSRVFKMRKDIENQLAGLYKKVGFASAT